MEGIEESKKSESEQIFSLWKDGMKIVWTTIL